MLGQTLQWELAYNYTVMQQQTTPKFVYLFQRGLLQGFDTSKAARSSAIPRSSSIDNVV